MAITTEPLSADRLFDLIVIGSGPAALAVVTRILESRPAALYTDDEHIHLHWLKRKQNGNGGGGGNGAARRAFLHTRWENGKKVLVSKTANDAGNKVDKDARQACECEGVMRILVVDRLGAWMANWDRLFRAYEIAHLRSPLFFHPAPSDLDALLAFAERSGCTMASSDLIEIAGCVGKEISKHKHKKGRARTTKQTSRMGPAVNERERKDYFTPSARLFSQFIQRDLVQRYGLHNDDKVWMSAREMFSSSRRQSNVARSSQAVHLVRGEVKALEWTTVHVDGWDTMEAFCVDLHDDVRLAAKAVVCATGAGVTPNVPAFLAQGTAEAVKGHGWCHSTQIGLPGRAEVLPQRASDSTAPFHLVVVGGGLTSAQLCDVAIRKRTNVRVTLIIRRHLQVKPFDVGLEWIGRYANLEKMQFWQESDPNERLRKLRQARNGGSITPRYAKLLKQYEQQGRLTMMTCTDVESATWDKDDEEWTMTTIDRTTDERKTMSAQYIISATGAAPQLDKLPFMSKIRSSTSATTTTTTKVDEYGGLPFVTEDLQYGTLPLFFTGAFSALQIGPGAFNLEGMRAAADRIAVRLREIASPESVATDDARLADDNDDDVATTGSAYTHFAYNVLAHEVEA